MISTESPGLVVPAHKVAPCMPILQGLPRRTALWRRGVSLPTATALGRDAPQAATRPAVPAPPSLVVDFLVDGLALPFGDSAVVVGSAPELGSWNPQRGLVLQWGEGDTWSSRAQLSPGEISFKVRQHSAKP